MFSVGHGCVTYDARAGGGRSEEGGGRREEGGGRMEDRQEGGGRREEDWRQGDKRSCSVLGTTR